MKRSRKRQPRRDNLGRIWKSCTFGGAMTAKVWLLPDSPFMIYLERTAPTPDGKKYICCQNDEEFDSAATLSEAMELCR